MKSSADENGDFDDVRDDKVDIEMARLLISSVIRMPVLSNISALTNVFIITFGFFQHDFYFLGMIFFHTYLKIAEKIDTCSGSLLCRNSAGKPPRAEANHPPCINRYHNHK